MKPGFKFVTSVAVLVTCSLCGICECSAAGSYSTLVGVLGVFGGSQLTSAFPPFIQKRLGAPTPQIGGGGPPVSFEDEDSDEEDEDDLLESQPRVEPQITTMNRDQCLAKLLCGMSVPVTGGNSKKSYYNEYAQIVSKFFEAFPLDEEYQSKESIETYDDYSNEDEKPTRMNSKRKPLNSSRVDATAPTFQLFDLALVDVAKPEELQNQTKAAAIQKVSTGNRIARARRIVENIGQKLQTVRQCQSINGCPYTFKQLREKLKKKEAQRVASNVPLPGPIWPANPNRRQQPTAESFQPKPEREPSRPIPPTGKPEPISVEPLFSNEEPIFPYKDTHKGDDELEEIFGPPQISKKPLGFHQGVDHNFNYEYNPDKPWRPGSSGGNSYGYRPWKAKPKPQSATGNGKQRPPGKPQGKPPQGPSQKKAPPKPTQQQVKRTPGPTASQKQAKPHPPPPATTRSPFPKKKISYLNSPYRKPSGGSDDDEDSEDINKVAPVELVGNFDAGEDEPTSNKRITTEAPEEAGDTSSSKNSKRQDDDDDSDEEYDDDDDYYDDEYDEEDELQEDEDVDDDDNYSDEDEEDDKDSVSKKKRKQKKEKKVKRKKKPQNKKTESVADDLPQAKKNVVVKGGYDDENEGVSEIWTKLNFATTGGANYKAPEKLNKNDEDEKKANDDNEEASEEDDDDGEDEEDARKGSLAAMKHKIRSSSTSTSASDEDDDEVDDENASKPKRKKSKSKSRAKSGSKKEEKSSVKETPENDVKGKKSKKKPEKKPSSDEENDSGQTRRKNVMLEIGGRPLVPKPESDAANAQKTSGLVSNRFKLQLINPYGPAAPPAPSQPLDVKPHGSYTPLRASLPTSASAPSNAGVGSSLPFNLKINSGPLASLTGAFGGMGGDTGGNNHNTAPPSGGSSGPSSGPIEYDRIPNHHPPQHHQPSSFMSQQHYSPQTGPSGGSGGLFKLNPIQGLTNLFKRPSAQSFDPMLSGPQGQAPPPSAFMHRPVGPESSLYRRDRPSPASGSSSGKKGRTGIKGKGKKGKV